MLYTKKRKILVCVVAVLVVLSIVGLVIFFCNKDKGESGTNTPPPTPIIEQAKPTNTPTPKPSISYGDKNGTNGDKDITIDQSQKNKDDNSSTEGSIYDREFTSEKYVTYEDGKIIFNFDEYTQDAVFGKTEDTQE